LIWVGAWSSVEGVAATMQSLIRLLARPQKVELDIVATQLGPMECAVNRRQ
jgi:hypothetical protein